ncbi:hypothetical protein TRIUR3_05725 [Triticum urartu]|uniref:Uncharacterized protein n=1 Tax=Triticum urartu TaxID=4572 RepID=M7YTR9_TRIUA|nr:hypothetical protein TRIUR3_05725 [Triticum urartu]
MRDTLGLLPPDAVPRSYQDQVKVTPRVSRRTLGSTISWLMTGTKGSTAGEQNVVLISVPSVLSEGLAPPGKHILHAYTPGTEPFGLWDGLDRKSAAYRSLKEERSEVMWKAVELALGPKFSREKCEVKLVGTPLTHKRFLRRNRGTYGPAIKAGEATFPGRSSPWRSTRSSSTPSASDRCIARTLLACIKFQVSPVYYIKVSLPALQAGRQAAVEKNHATFCSVEYKDTEKKKAAY